MKNFKEDIRNCSSDELKFLRFLNKIMNANLDKEKKKKLWLYILNLPSSPYKIPLSPNVLDRIKEHALEEFGKDKSINDIKWQLWGAERNSKTIMTESEKIKTP